jgi:hypothetical protein
MAAETLYTANTQFQILNTANSNLNGTGTVASLLTASSNGTLIKSVTIKATGSTAVGMIRLFVSGGGNTRLLREIEVPMITPAANSPAFETKVDLNFCLLSGYILKGSTENADNFNVITEGLDWTYNSQGVRMDTTQYTTNFGYATLTTADSSMTGAGALLVFSSNNSDNGCSIKSITIKAAGKSTTSGMIRLFLDDGTGTALTLFKEIMVPSQTPDATDQSFEYTVVFENDWDVKAGYCIYASTQNSEIFNVTVEANDWSYAA